MVRAHIVHCYDVARPKSREQNLFQILDKTFPCRPALIGCKRLLPIQTNGRQDKGVFRHPESRFARADLSLGAKRFSSVEESIADLKDPNKDCSCTPDSLLVEVMEFVKKFQQELDWFRISYYEAAFSSLSPIQIEYF